jgi:hypothetical protein
MRGYKLLLLIVVVKNVGNMRYRYRKPEIIKENFSGTEHLKKKWKTDVFNILRN